MGQTNSTSNPSKTGTINSLKNADITTNIDNIFKQQYKNDVDSVINVSDTSTININTIVDPIINNIDNANVPPTKYLS